MRSLFRENHFYHSRYLFKTMQNWMNFSSFSEKNVHKYFLFFSEVCAKLFERREKKSEWREDVKR